MPDAACAVVRSLAHCPAEYGGLKALVVHNSGTVGPIITVHTLSTMVRGIPRDAVAAAAVRFDQHD